MKIKINVVFNVIALFVGVLTPLYVWGQSVDGQQPVSAKPNFVPADILAKAGERVAIVTKSGTKIPSIPFSPVSNNNKTATPTPTVSWNGFYVGGHFGYGWGKTATNFDPLPDAVTFRDMQPITISSNINGVTVGGQAGYNWQSGHFVGGPEATISWSNIKGSKTVTPIVRNGGFLFPGGIETTGQDIDYLATFRGRAGGAWGRVFIYGTAGLAFGKVNYSATTDYRPAGTTQYPASISQTKTGWTAGRKRGGEQASCGGAV